MWTHDILSPLSPILPYASSSSSPSICALSPLHCHLPPPSFLFSSRIIYILYGLMDEKSPLYFSQSLSFSICCQLFPLFWMFSSIRLNHLVLDCPLNLFALKFNSIPLLSILDLSNHHNLFSSSCYQTFNSSLSF